MDLLVNVEHQVASKYFKTTVSIHLYHLELLSSCLAKPVWAAVISSLTWRLAFWLWTRLNLMVVNMRLDGQFSLDKMKADEHEGNSLARMRCPPVCLARGVSYYPAHFLLHQNCSSRLPDAGWVNATQTDLGRL
jgi:hypothetical protein